MVTAEESCVVRVDVLSREHFFEIYRQIIDSQYDEKFDGQYIMTTA